MVHFANAELLKIHLGDQTDSKLLLGTYVTSTPGNFKWQPGVLTTAVNDGRWILVEDIDLAPTEVISVLLPLLETRWLHIPSRGESIKAKRGFQIFATRRSQKAELSAERCLGENLWTHIYMPEPSMGEVREIILSSHSLLNPLFDRMISIFNEIKAYPCYLKYQSLNLCDFKKWCHRVAYALTDDQPQIEAILFREALDCFAAKLADYRERREVSFLIGLKVGQTENRSEFYLDHFLPNIQSAEKLTVGRVVLSKISQKRDDAPFANTSSSLRLLEKIAVAVKMIEPVLLVGETGTGKTTTIQKLAKELGQNLIVLNMSQQSDSSDLLGGFKPVDLHMLISPVVNDFYTLFTQSFSQKSNQGFLEKIKTSYEKKNYMKLVQGLQNAVNMAKTVSSADFPKKKKRKLDPSIVSDWQRFEIAVQNIAVQINKVNANFLFSFVEGTLVKAIKNGDWILLDEINLATSETLECLGSLLQSSSGSIMLLERGDTTPVKRHPNFRLFACMNPANDAGKRDLPPGLRSRFTEVWVDSPDSTLHDLILIIKCYIFKFLPAGAEGDNICHEIAQFYISCKDLSTNGLIFDGANQRFHVSVRTLTRALVFAYQIAPVYNLRRALYEGFFMMFMTSLGPKSYMKVFELLRTNILKTVKNAPLFTKQVPRNPFAPDTSSLIDCFFIENGPEQIVLDDFFIQTDSVKMNLANLARGIVSKQPILIQGPTSAGKTSMIEYLSKKTGHRFIRINNHEHTDLQEYLGSYISNEKGELCFQEVFEFKCREF